MSGEDFFSRWSRRKREVRQAETAAPRPPELAEEASDAVEPLGRAETAEGALPDPELTPEEVAALPPIDALTPETDLSAFFRKGVPAALRNAALRRMWSLDPAIRDYVGDARDYAWDWNTPGGVPGFEPLASADEVYATLDRMFSTQDASETDQKCQDDHDLARGPKVARHGDEPVPEEESPGPKAGSAGFDVPQQSPPESSGGHDEGGTAEPEISAAVQHPDLAAPQEASAGARPRRHGGAAPH